MNHLFYEATLRIVTPLAIGNGQSHFTDSDLVRDSFGKPIIPASAVAGVLRSLFIDYDLLGRNELSIVFGSTDKAQDGPISSKVRRQESKLVFHDVVLPCSSVHSRTLTRDCIKINPKTGLTEEGAKCVFH